VKRLLPIALAVAAVALPGAAPGAYCSPLNCAASGAAVSANLLAARPNGFTGVAQVVDLRTGKVKWRLPSGILNGRTLVEQSSAHEVTWHDAVTGAVTGKASFPGSADTFSLVGVSQDGHRAVLMQRVQGQSMVVVSKSGSTSVDLPGKGWDFDALNGNTLYLVHYLARGYEIRRYDIRAQRLDPKPLKDPKASSTIWGAAWERLASRDGRYLFTLYLAADGGAMVHQLDLRTSAARCIDLPGSGDFGAGTTWTMSLSPNGKTLWAVSPGFGRVVGIDVGTRKVRVAFRFARDHYGASSGPVSAVSAVCPPRAPTPRGGGGRLVFF
jgi:hypothetical protein